MYKLRTLKCYTINVTVYCGNEDEQNCFSNPHTVMVVMGLKNHLLNSARILYSDNCYSGVPLVKKNLLCGVSKIEVVRVHNGKGIKIK